ncbi:PPOX class F420-dependent oxidoreductase [Goodfellowiella coeruleoviolacea]|uniref:PPOX class probable F420-dependent enzyme n=1 Tax=Goodfellowiella coeruleoviolacea TaxID=334858 RepID=A0AAE3KNH0_9PSEU|nr:PPOX class F420-dependent oxidoreductase [Goodfellowiella coeruleoviolacea]MCP2168668.1 PPOX class probable F420-dependent enzyme [Goodfellowiella coeruleoviolacea]
MRTMSEQEWRDFVGEGTRTGKLAVVRKDGSPHVTPVWFLIDDATPDAPHIVFTTEATSVKGRALRRDGRFSLCVDKEHPPYGYVRLDGVAELSEDLDDLLTWATRLGTRYMGEDLGPAYGRRNGVPGELLVRGRITKVVAVDNVSD